MINAAVCKKELAILKVPQENLILLKLCKFTQGACKVVSLLVYDFS